jgi:hypothetical protein
MQKLVSEWVNQGWVAPYAAQWKRLGGAPSFFGLPQDASTTTTTTNSSSSSQPVYVGVGGMHHIPRALLSSLPADIFVHRGRALSVKRNNAGQWEIRYTTGNAAFHDTPEEEAKKNASAERVCTADAVVVTDASASQETWHRASAG